MHGFAVVAQNAKCQVIRTVVSRVPSCETPASDIHGDPHWTANVAVSATAAEDDEISILYILNFSAET